MAKTHWTSALLWTIALSTSTAQCLSNIIKRRDQSSKTKSLFTDDELLSSQNPLLVTWRTLLSISILLVFYSVVTEKTCPSCKTAAHHPYPLHWPSQQFHCSSTCGRCCWASNRQLWTPGSLAAADGPWSSGPPGAGSRPAAGRTFHPSAGCSPSPAVLQCDAAGAPGSPPADRARGGAKNKATSGTHVTYFNINFSKFILFAFVYRDIIMFTLHQGLYRWSLNIISHFLCLSCRTPLHMYVMYINRKITIYFSPPLPHSLEHLVGPVSSSSHTLDGPELPLARCSPKCQDRIREQYEVPAVVLTKSFPQNIMKFEMWDGCLWLLLWGSQRCYRWTWHSTPTLAVNASWSPHGPWTPAEVGLTGFSWTHFHCSAWPQPARDD